MLRLVAAVERESEHPLAKPIVKAAKQRGIERLRAERFESVGRHGAVATVDGRRVLVGTRRLLEREHASEAVAALKELASSTPRGIRGSADEGKRRLGCDLRGRRLVFCSLRAVLDQAQKLGLPSGIRACLFDLDGVLTQTSHVHARAWKEMFDALLRERPDRTGGQFVPFDPVADYAQYVDGKPRYDGVRSFLASRGIELPEGHPSDPPSAETVYGLGNRKNELVLSLLRRDGVQVYDGSVRYVRGVRDAGLHRAVVSASANTREVLQAARIEDLFEVRIDGIVAAERHLRGKPAPDPFFAAADELHVPAMKAAVFEDALAGVEAGRAGHFGFVVGVDRENQRDALLKHGADVVVDDLAELLKTP